MTKQLRTAAVLLIAALAPISVSAALIDVSDLTITAFAGFRTQLAPQQSDRSVKVVPPSSEVKAEALVLAAGIPFPNQPSGQNEPDGAFGFRLPFRFVEGLKLADIGAGDIFELTYEFFAAASTGFGETGVFATIGDPFDLALAMATARPPRHKRPAGKAG